MSIWWHRTGQTGPAPSDDRVKGKPLFAPLPDDPEPNDDAKIHAVMEGFGQECREVCRAIAGYVNGHLPIEMARDAAAEAMATLVRRAQKGEMGPAQMIILDLQDEIASLKRIIEGTDANAARHSAAFAERIAALERENAELRANPVMVAMPPGSLGEVRTALDAAGLTLAHDPQTGRLMILTAKSGYEVRREDRWMTGLGFIKPRTKRSPGEVKAVAPVNVFRSEDLNKPVVVTDISGKRYEGVIAQPTDNHGINAVLIDGVERLFSGGCSVIFAAPKCEHKNRNYMRSIYSPNVVGQCQDCGAIL